MMLPILLAALQAPVPLPSVRDAQRLELQREVARTDGVWRLREWGHYFVLTDVRDEGFLSQLERHAFHARQLCTSLFPESESDPVRDDRRLAVVRVMKNREEYDSYGEAPGTWGFWNPTAGEIVIHDDKDRNPTWDALGGCVAHAFLDEFFGRAARAEWFKGGLAEYVASSYRVGIAEETRFPGTEWRLERLRRTDLTHWPALEAVLAAPRTDWTLPPGVDQPYPRMIVWTFMRLLCAEELHGADFDPRWALIPERYAVGWVCFRDETKAREFAFEGLDRAALERAWRASVRGG